LIQQGAKLVQEASDILDELSPMYTSALRPPGGPVGSKNVADLKELSDDETKVLRLLSDDPEPVHIDFLAERAPFGVARVQTALFGLELRGLVEQSPGRYYLCRPSAPEPRGPA
jgi:DNA processing protein